MKRFTFFIQEYDSQASIVKYYKKHSYANDWETALNKVSLPIRNDYDYKLLTLKQFNSLKKRSPLYTAWEVIMLLYPFKIWRH